MCKKKPTAAFFTFDISTVMSTTMPQRLDKESPRILIIDSTPIVEPSLAGALRQRGFTVFIAQTCTEGIELAHKHLPNLIVLEMYMDDGCTGFDVMQQLKPLETTILPLYVMLTSKPTLPLLRSVVNAGAIDCLNKNDIAECVSIIIRRLAYHKRSLNLVDRWMQNMRNSLLVTLSHEFRNPLATLLAAAELLQLYSLNSNDHQELTIFATETMKAGLKLRRHLERCLYYVGLVSLQIDVDGDGLNRLRQEQSSITTHLVNEIIHRVKAEYPQSEINLRLDFQDSTIPVAMEIRALMTVLQELLDNAFKFSPPQSDIRINGKVDNNAYEFEIYNTGRPLTQKQIDAIGAFVQFDRERYEQQGLGLGLMTVKIIAELFNASFSVLPCENSTHVQFRIPFQTAEPPKNRLVGSLPFSHHLLSIGYDL